jgi:hypothetical protein
LSDVNLDTGLLQIPKPMGGEARAFDLPLPTLLVDLFRARWTQHQKLFAEDKKTAPWVFAAPDSASGHIVEVRAGRLGVSPLCQPTPPAVPAARVVPIVEPNIIPFARAKKRAAAR